jgi:hypothetical protein
VALTAVACGESPTSPSRINSAFAPNTLNRTVTGDTGSTANAEFTAADSSYVAYEASANLTLAEIGYLAHKNGDSLQVKGFGFQLWQDFRAAQEDLSNTAGASAIRNATMNMADLATFNSLRRLSGSQFDKEFVRWVIDELAAQRVQARAFRTGQSALVQAHAQGLDNETSRYINMARDMETYF